MYSSLKGPQLASSNVWQDKSHESAKNDVKLKFISSTQFYICDKLFSIDSGGYIVYNWTCHLPTPTKAFHFGVGDYVRVHGHYDADSYVVEKIEMQIYQ